MFPIGDTLRQARERRGLSFVQIERDLKLRARQLQALEDERFEALPGRIYARAFLGTYAEYLGLDSSLYLAEYDARWAPEDTEEQVALFPPHGPRRRRSRALGTGILVVAAAVALVALGAWRLSGRRADDARSVAPAANRARADAALRARKPVAPVVPRVVANPAPRPRPRGLVLTTSAGPCWLSIHRDSAAGPVVYEGLLGQGRTLRLRGRLWLRIGAPGALRLTVDGHRVTLPGDGGVVNLLVARGAARIL